MTTTSTASTITMGAAREDKQCWSREEEEEEEEEEGEMN